MMQNESKIYVAGHRGLVGSALVRQLLQHGYHNLVCRTHAELDLTNSAAVEAFFQQEKPEYVFLAAAKVGGIMANNVYRADFILENLQIQNNVISMAHRYGVKKLMFLGSSCIYPKLAPQPMPEECLLTDTLEYTNEPYAIAKIAGIKLCESFNIQYNTNFISVMPTNLYGPNDNYNLEKSHVLPALIRKMHLGKLLSQHNWEAVRRDLQLRPVNGTDGTASEQEIVATLARFGIYAGAPVKVELWGTGLPQREFLHSNDMASACVFVMNKIDFKHIVAERGMSEMRNTHLNIGSGVDLSIGELASLVQEVTGFEGELVWNHTKPDGTMRKLMDVSRLSQLGWSASIPLREGIRQVYAQYCED